MMETEIISTYEQLFAKNMCSPEWDYDIIIKYILSAIRTIISEHVRVPEIADMIIVYAGIDSLELLKYISALYTDSISINLGNRFYVYVSTEPGRYLHLNCWSPAEMLEYGDPDTSSILLLSHVLDALSSNNQYFFGSCFINLSKLHIWVFEDICKIGQACIDCLTNKAKILLLRFSDTRFPD